MYKSLVVGNWIPTWITIDPSPTSRSFPSCWNASFCGGYWSISRSTIFFWVCSPPIASVILQILRLQGYYRISWWHSTVATWQHWPSWTCLMRSTRSITASYCAVSAYHYGIPDWRSAGSACTCPSTALRLACWNAVNARVHKVRGSVLGLLLLSLSQWKVGHIDSNYAAELRPAESGNGMVLPAAIVRYLPTPIFFKALRTVVVL